MRLEKLDKFHKTNPGYLLFGLVELILAYAAISWAIDSGRILAYTLAIILLVGGLQNIIKLIGSFFYGRYKAS
jgi:uncharacterized membrane protein HdeD (DUF308 family)